MSDSERQTQHNALQRKLRELVDCVMAKAAEDAAFAERLAQILLNSTSERAVQPAAGRQARHTFNPVQFLKEHGEAALARELECQTDDDLRAILRAQGLRRGKDLKKLGRPEMLGEISSGARTKLEQGTVVARVETAEHRGPTRPDADAAGPGSGGSKER